MLEVQIVLPVSRPDHLQRLFAALEALECNASTTGLLCYVDGGTKLFVEARNFTQLSKFAGRLCVQRKFTHPPRQFDLASRRVRIANIHNELRSLIGESKYVLLIEDDSIPPPYALKRLLRAYSFYPYAGLISGVEVGRHGHPALGLWQFDDVYEPTKITSLLPPADMVPFTDIQSGQIKEIDACGLYCVLTKYAHYAKHEFKPFDVENLGPDVQWSSSLRQQGFKNYFDYGVQVEHRTHDGQSLTLQNSTIEQVTFTKNGECWEATVTPADQLTQGAT